MIKQLLLVLSEHLAGELSIVGCSRERKQHQHLCEWIPFLYHKEIEPKVSTPNQKRKFVSLFYAIHPGRFNQVMLDDFAVRAHTQQCCTSILTAGVLAAQGWQETWHCGGISPTCLDCRLPFYLHTENLEQNPMVFMSNTTHFDALDMCYPKSTLEFTIVLQRV